MINIEVVYAKPHEQKLIKLQVPENTNMIQAVELSKINEFFPEINLAELTVGIFGKVEMRPTSRILSDGDRIEIYRPLIADPKEVRKKRAAKVAKVESTPVLQAKQVI